MGYTTDELYGLERRLDIFVDRRNIVNEKNGIIPQIWGTLDVVTRTVYEFCGFHPRRRG